MKHGHCFPTFIIVSMVTAKEIGIAIVAIIVIYVGCCIIAFTVKVWVAITNAVKEFLSWLRSWFFTSSEDEEHNQAIYEILNQPSPFINHNNHNNHNSNNHDDRKFKHSTRASAEAEVRRMTMSGDYDECERLNVYRNDEFGGWYVGRGWRR